MSDTPEYAQDDGTGANAGTGDPRRPPVPPGGPIQPNMLVVTAEGYSSTFANVNLSHSVLTEVNFFNTRLHQSNFEGAVFNDGDLDGAAFIGCSMRGVQLINCDVDRLVVNGVNIGNLLRLLQGQGAIR